MKVPRLRAESELQLLAYATATATQDLSSVCDLTAMPDPQLTMRGQGLNLHPYG